MTEKIDCEKYGSAEMMVELSKRGYVVLEKKHYNQLLDSNFFKE